ncbi:MAG: hypothetical protein QHI38_07980 [Armatimonadota bacterium]|nr:hypothetical protein [Armatimonadota bacterium]
MINTAAIRTRVCEVVRDSILDNPVIARELRTRMREWKAFAIFGGYVLLAAVVLLFHYGAEISRSSGHIVISRSVGLEVFRSLAWVQAVLLTFVLPSLTFSSLTQELERRTIEMLALTRLTAGKIVLGKQLAGLLFALILVICTLPLASLCVMLGGISPWEVGLCYILLAAWCYLLTSMGVFWSSLCTRTVASSLLAYGTAATYFFMTMSMGATATFAAGPSPSKVYVLAGLNPGFAPDMCTMNTQVYGIDIPVWLVAVGLHIWAGALMLLVSSTHVKYKFAERALPIRLMLIGLTATMTWLVIGDSTVTTSMAQNPEYVRGLIVIAVGVLLGLICLGTTAVATGVPQLQPSQSIWSYALSARKAFRTDIAGAIVFATIWSAVACGTLGISLIWALKSSFGSVTAATASPSIIGFIVSTLSRLCIDVCVISAAVAAVGVLSSCCAKLRKNAAGIVLLFTILAFSGYMIPLAYYVNGVTKTNGPLWQLAAFWPVTPILGLTVGWQDMPELWWQPEDSWMVTAAAYLVIAAVALWLSPKALARYGGVIEE